MIQHAHGSFSQCNKNRHAVSLLLVSALIAVLLQVCEPQRADGGNTAVRFAWAPPNLQNPTVLVLDGGSTYNLLDDNADYVIHLPDTVKTGSTMIEGGRNIVIMGGHITVPAGGTTDAERRGLYIKNATGTVHIEGIQIDGVNEDGFDGIAISAPKAIVQIVNVRVEGIRGTFAGFHGDVVQPFGGVRELRIDHLTGISNYQGLYLTETRGNISSADIRNVNLSYEDNSVDATTYLLWLPVNPHTCETTYPVSLDHVFIAPRQSQLASASAVWPNDSVPKPCPAVTEGKTIQWPALPPIQGFVIDGSSPWGDFVTSGSVGIGYAPHLPVPPLHHLAQRLVNPGEQFIYRDNREFLSLLHHGKKLLYHWY